MFTVTLLKAVARPKDVASGDRTNKFLHFMKDASQSFPALLLFSQDSGTAILLRESNDLYYCGIHKQNRIKQLIKSISKIK